MDQKKRKTNIIGTFVYRALKICFPDKFSSKVKKIKNILRQNEYPEEVIISDIRKKISNFQISKRFGPKKCPVYIKLPWIRNVSLKYQKQTKSKVNNCFGLVVSARIIFSSKKMLPSFQKDILPAHQRSKIVYKYSCHCDSVSVGRTSQDWKNKFDNLLEINLYLKKISLDVNVNPLKTHLFRIRLLVNAC